MRNRRFLCKGRASGNFAIEYAFLIAVVVASLLGMAVYMKRAIAGRWRGIADSMGHGQQYDPKKSVTN